MTTAVVLMWSEYYHY